ncbi:MAG TPA: T9SS type A sorting domain-containing protein [Candidatus Eisenbacteria bacterium]|nr:T9SS type A sorting domain-containing protein [Candidatus Eisenbacteria bacterium]
MRRRIPWWAVLALGIAWSVGSANGDAATLFGLVDTGEFYASSDGGATWSATGTIPLHDAVGLAAGASATDLYIAGRSGTVYRSPDGGSSWAAVGVIPASDVSGFAIQYDGSLLALTETGSVYRSADQGATFAASASLSASNWVGLARGPLGRLYACTRTGEIVESQDGGSTWATVAALAVSNAAAIRRRGSELYLLTETGEVARSLDYGRTWLTVGAMASSEMVGLVEMGSSLIAAARTGEVATSSSGASWTWVGSINQLSVMALGTDTPQATGVESEPASAPRLALRPPSPNPSFGASGSIFSISLSAPDFVRVSLYDLAGRLVAARPAEWVAGSASFRWAPEPLATGTYFARFTTGSGRVASVKWTIVR